MSETKSPSEDIKKLSTENPIRRKACFDATEEIMEIQDIIDEVPESERKIINERLKSKLIEYNAMDCNAVKISDIYAQKQQRVMQIHEANRGVRICFYVFLFIFLLSIFLFTFGYDTFFYIEYGMDTYSFFSIITFILFILIIAYCIAQGQRE